MTQQTAAAPSDVSEVEPLNALPEIPWLVGKTYLCRNRVTKVVIVSTRLRGSQPIAGIQLADSPGEGDQVGQWTAAGLYNAPREGVLDLTTEIT